MAKCLHATDKQGNKGLIIDNVLHLGRASLKTEIKHWHRTNLLQDNKTIKYSVKCENNYCTKECKTWATCHTQSDIDNLMSFMNSVQLQGWWTGLKGSKHFDL